jgi:hypothetical protein
MDLRELATTMANDNRWVNEQIDTATGRLSDEERV